MPAGVVFLCPENRADLKDSVKTAAHKDSLEELGALVQKSFPVKVGNRKKRGAALGCSRHDLGGLGSINPFSTNIS